MAVDITVQELYKYKGSSPCPKDFDEFWDRSLTEAKNLSDKPEFIPQSFSAKGAEFYDLYFTGTKGAKIHAKVGIPDKNARGDKKIPALCWFHGLDGYAQPWSDLMIYVSQGFAVAYLDVRGQGGLSQDAGGYLGMTSVTPFMRGVDGNPDDLLMRDVFLDTVIMSEIMMNLEYVDENRVGVFGSSQGGGLALACAALNPKIKRCAISIPYLSDYKRVWEMGLAKDAYAGLKNYFRNFDPLHKREDEIFEKLGYIDIQNLAKRVKADVIMATGLEDTLCPPSTQFAMFNKLTSKKEAYIFPDFGHEIMKDYNDTSFEFLCELCD